jgi:hypothetical protein
MQESGRQKTRTHTQEQRVGHAKKQKQMLRPTPTGAKAAPAGEPGSSFIRMKTMRMNFLVMTNIGASARWGTRERREKPHP